ncbi:hypothetical protein I6N96_15035 [Enterococcus sp. BWM-S5]|uniref:LXG domain-containing protein n=1 Tax=Enterococcus larvae TaxID=2794352 RepID=A0ABS4CMC7_9ENTE|nr:hypothetical protein [Enterococcus larvae]MBP1047600.1 hypothetical protein [Enterococcus larvae]
MKNNENKIQLFRKNHQEACEQLHSNISSLFFDIHQDSKCHEATKVYHDMILLPLVRGAALLAEMIGEANVKLSEEYLLAVEQSRIAAADLGEQIDEWDELIHEVQKKLKKLAVSSLDPLNKAFQISKCTTLLGLYGSIKRELKHELTQMENVDEQHSSALIGEINCLNQWINQGYTLANSCWDKEAAEFTEPAPEELEWIAQINKAEESWLKKHQTKKYLLDPFEKEE